ncbi:hypothetical protein ACB098_02G002700 [Castanea mollissima]
MDLDVYNGAKTGKIEVFRNSSPPLHLQELLTPNGNTVLHVYLTALSKRPESSTANFVEEILKMCRLLLRLESSTANFVAEILRMCPSLRWQANAKGEIPLHIAARHGHATMVKVLINFADSRTQNVERGERNAQTMLQITNKEKETALHEAIRYNHLEVVELLLEVDPNYSYSANDVGETPLYMAVERNFQDLAFKILDTCESPAYDGPIQRTVLHAAVICDNREMTQEILEKIEAGGALAKQADQQGRTPLHLAALFNSISTIEPLLTFDRDVAYIKDKNGRTALHIAAHRGNRKVIQKILSRCPDCFELVDSEGRNVLHIAVATSVPGHGPRGTVNFFLRFLRFSNLLNEKDADGNTPLHLHSNSLWIQRFLMRHPKVDKMAFNKQNLNAYDLALTSDKLPSAKTLYVMRHFEGLNFKKCQRLPEKAQISDSQFKAMISMMEKNAKAQAIVDALIATVSFTAGITVPGGFVQDGRNAGSAILMKNDSFKAFIILDTIALVLSTSALFIHLSMMPTWIHTTRVTFAVRRFFSQVATILTLLATGTMVLSFATGTYAVLAHSLSLAIATCIIGLSFFVIIVLLFSKCRLSSLLAEAIISLTQARPKALCTFKSLKHYSIS